MNPIPNIVLNPNPMSPDPNEQWSDDPEAKSRQGATF